MQIRIMSDLHLEFEDFNLPQLENEKEMVLVLAGDIIPYKIAGTPIVDDFFYEMSSRHRHVVYVFGNHEFFGGHFNTDHALFKEHVKEIKNLTLLECDDIVIDDVAFVGSTLFTDFDNGNPSIMFRAPSYMTDYGSIRVKQEQGSRFLTPEDVLSYHKAAREAILKRSHEHTTKGRKVVLVTHHGVSFRSVDARFAGNSMNSCFYSEMMDELLDSGVKLAIHGHTHASHDYLCGADDKKVRVVCNPKGYVTENYYGFNPNLVVEI